MKFFERTFKNGKVSLQGKEELLEENETFSGRKEVKELSEEKEFNCFYNY